MAATAATANPTGGSESTTVVNRNPKRKPVLIGKPVDEYDLKRMPLVLRSKVAYYLDPASRISEAQASSRKRLDQLKKLDEYNKQRELDELELITQTIRSSSASVVFKNQQMSMEQRELLLRQEKERHDRLIGQLKAAEARNRTRLLKMRYVNLKEDESEHLIDSQPTALHAARLEAFLPTQKASGTSGKKSSHHDVNNATTSSRSSDRLKPTQRRRLEAILDGDVIERKN